MGAFGRRLGSFAFAVGLGVTTLALAVGIGAAAERWSFRIDLTAAGDQKLSPRTRQVLSAARERGTYRIAVAGPWSALDSRSARELNDVLDLFEGSGVGVSRIDPETAEGRAAFDELLGQLAAADGPRAREQRDAVERALVAGERTERYLREGLAPAFRQLASMAPPESADTFGRGVREQAAMVETGAQALAAALAQAKALLEQADAELPLPIAEISVPLSGALAARATELDGLGVLLTQIAGAEDQVGEAVARAAEPISEAVATQRDHLAIAADEIAQLRPTDGQRAAASLRQNSGVIAIGPGGVIATPFEALLPQFLGAARADMRQLAEERLATLVTVLVDPHRPIVVFVHGESRVFFEEVPLLARVMRRLSELGIESVEWAAAVDPTRPSLVALDPEGVRPVVYVALAPDSSSGGAAGQSGAERAVKFGRTLASLADSGASILVSMNPSVLPGTGSTDDAVAWLEAFGLSPMTGSPLLTSAESAAVGRVVAYEASVLAEDTDHPLGGALAGLPTRFPWPIALQASHTPPAGVRITTIFELENAWAESDWLGVWQTPGPQRMRLPNPPSFDEGRDERAASWVIGAAVERNMPGVGRPQRLVVMGSNGWWLDSIVFAVGEVEQRPVRLHPGNLELLESSVLWLAGKDDQLTRSTAARALPRMRQLDGEQERAVRWALLAGLPGGVLALGVLWRLIAG